ncbi:MAG: hypothetical protein WAK80_10970, partial [Candidatus Cybelea sp.]
MATRIVERPIAARKPAIGAAPRAYPAKWTAILLAMDVALFIVASALGAFIGFHHWNSPRILSHLLIADAIFVGLWVLVFDRLGLYRRTYALSMKDELYYTVAALMLGTIPQMVLFTIYPEISTSRVALIVSLGFSILMVGSARAVLHQVRNQEWFKSRRKVSIVGTQENVERVLESLELSAGTEAQLIVVDDCAEAIERIDLSRDPNLNRIEWFNHARRSGCDSLILTEMIPPNLLAHILEVAAADRISL